MPRLTVIAFGLLLAGITLFSAHGCGTTNPDALPDDTGVPNTDQFTVNGKVEDTGLVMATPEKYMSEPVAPPPPDMPLPASVDLTSKLPPVGDQGQLGSCAAWTCAYGLATWLANVNNTGPFDQPASQASPAFLYAKTMEAQMSTCDSGSQMDVAMNLLIKEGCSSLATVPYSATVCVQNPGTDDANKFRIGSFGNIRTPNDRTALKKALAAGRPLAFGLALLKNFSDYKTGVYVAAGASENGKHAGHAMVLMGYDDAMGAYRIMNSWGATWGDSGYMWWQYDDFEKYMAPSAGEAYEVFSTPAAGTPRVQDGVGMSKYGLELTQRRDGAGASYLILTLSLPVAIQITTITCTDPTGATATSGYGDNWFSGGPLCFVHPDGKAWPAGRYALTIQGLRADGSAAEFSSDATLGSDTVDRMARDISADLAPAGFDADALGTTLHPVTLKQ